MLLRIGSMATLASVRAARSLMQDKCKRFGLGVTKCWVCRVTCHSVTCYPVTLVELSGPSGLEGSKTAPHMQNTDDTVQSR